MLVRRAMKLDPFHPTWLYFAIAHYHFDRGEYQEALAAARKLSLPGYFWTPINLAGIYAELGRESEAQSAVAELLRLYPGFTTETYVEEARKWNYQDETIRRWVAALRKAGLPEGTEA
jgi:tetratricopeptide (TPR) repeat protein